MARPKRSTETNFAIREVAVEEAQREFTRKRGRGSKYDSLVASVEKLEAGRALIIEKMKYPEVTLLRQRIKEGLGPNFKIDASRTDRENNRYDVMITRKG